MNRADAGIAPPPRTLWVAWLMIAATSIGLTAWATPNGLGISPDSVNYLSGARGLAAGLGHVGDADFDRAMADERPRAGEPIVEFPPLLSLWIAGGMRAGLEPESAARVLLHGSQALLTLLAGLLVWRTVLGRAAVAASVLAAWIVGVNGGTVRSGAFLLTEVPYVLFAVLAVGLATAGRSAGWLLAAGMAGAVAYGFRYAGLSLLLTLPIVVLACDAGPWRRRLVRAGLAGAAADRGGGGVERAEPPGRTGHRSRTRIRPRVADAAALGRARADRHPLARRQRPQGQAATAGLGHARGRPGRTRRDDRDPAPKNLSQPRWTGFQPVV